MKHIRISVYAVSATVAALFASGFLDVHHVEAQSKRPEAVLIRDAENPGRQPFSIKLSVPASGLVNFTVPADKRLVITHVDAAVTLPTVPDAIAILSTADGADSELVVPFSIATGPTSSNRYAVQQVMGFADPGSSVVVDFFVFAGGTGNALVNIHGYFVDI